MNTSKVTMHRDFLGMEIPVRVVFTSNPAFPGNREQPDEPAYREVVSVTTSYFTPGFCKSPQWVELDCSDEDMESIQEELEEL